MSMIDFIRKLNAAQKFKISDDFEVTGFEDMTEEMEDQDSMEMWATVKLTHGGDLPESYKVLNLMIGDWVEAHADSLTETIHGKLREYMEEKYPGSDHTALEQTEDSVIWMDQLDYMPQIEDDGTITIEVEIILHAEGDEEE
jgi:hypothetical protein